MTSCPATPKLSDVPLWRLLVMLDDVERAAGGESESARILSSEIQRRLRGERAAPQKEVAGAR